MYLLCSFGFILHELQTRLCLTSFHILHVLHSSSSSFKTANTLLFTLYQIAINPSIQERLRADIREVVGGDCTIRPEHISKLPLLKNSITEAQRWGWGEVGKEVGVEVGEARAYSREHAMPCTVVMPVMIFRKV